MPLVVTGILGVIALGPSNSTLIIVIGIVFTPLIARTVRAAVLQERELDYVAAARLRGEGSVYIMFAEILPNVLAPIMVEFTVRLGYAVFTIVTLSFLGFGIPPPSSELGPGDLQQLRPGDRRLLVGGAVRRARHRLPCDRCQHDRQFHRIHPGRIMTTSSDTTLDAATPRAGDALSLSHVDISYMVRRRPQRVVRDVSFHVARGESFGLVGESGCGKSTIALAIVRYLARNGRVSDGTIEIDGRDVLSLNRSELRRLRAERVSMVYQEPGRALNPSILIGRQVAEVYEIAGLDRKPALERAQEMLAKVRISDPKGVMGRYPHQLSGGMLQRVVIAMALASEPSLLILDEPTTALDATVEAEVLDLIRGLRAEFDTSLLFISHNLAVIAKMCDRVGVLYAGELVEEGPAHDVFNDPRHPYTVGLLRSIPRRDPGGEAGGTRAPLATIPRLAAGARIGDQGLHLCRPLRPGRRPLPRRRAADVRDRRRSRLALPLPRARRDGAAGRHQRAHVGDGIPRPCRRAGGADALGEQDLPHGRPGRPGAARGGSRHRRRGDGGTGRRVREWQDDAGAGADRPDRTR